MLGSESVEGVRVATNNRALGDRLSVCSFRANTWSCWNSRQRSLVHRRVTSIHAPPRQNGIAQMDTFTSKHLLAAPSIKVSNANQAHVFQSAFVTASGSCVSFSASVRSVAFRLSCASSEIASSAVFLAATAALAFAIGRPIFILMPTLSKTF